MATSTQRKVTLDDLDPAQLAELQAQAAARANAAAAAQTDHRTEGMLKLLRERDHLEGCPVGDPPEGQDRAHGRMEAYAHVRPANPAKARPAADVTVVRCIECGGQRVIDKPYPQVIAEIDGAGTTGDVEPDDLDLKED